MMQAIADLRFAARDWMAPFRATPMHGAGRAPPVEPAGNPSEDGGDELRRSSLDPVYQLK